MEKSKKKKVVITVSIIIAILIVLAVSLFFILKNVNHNKNKKDNASNVSITTIEEKYKEAEKAIIRKEIPYNYNGNYIFSHVGNVKFNEKLSEDQIKLILKNNGVKDLNSLIDKLNTKKQKESNDYSEILVFKNGRITRSYNKSNKIIFKGNYYGNDDLGEIYLTYKNADYAKLFPKTNYRISLTYTEDMNIASTGSEKTDDGKYVYIFKDYCNDNGDVLMTATYVYSRLKDTTNIIDNIDFNI